MDPQKKRFLTGLIISALLLVGLLVVYVVFLKRRKQNQSQEPKQETQKTTDEDLIEVNIEENNLDRSPESIMQVYDLIRANVPGDENFHKMVLAQSMHETGVFTSTLTRENNNLFGMRNPVIRDTLSLGDLNGYAYFKNIEDSVKDYALYVKERELISSYLRIDDFIKALKAKSYFEDNFIKYLSGVKKHYNFVKTLIQ